VGPYKNTSDLHLNVLQLVAGNSFFFAMLLFLAAPRSSFSGEAPADRKTSSACLDH